MSAHPKPSEDYGSWDEIQDENPHDTRVHQNGSDDSLEEILGSATALEVSTREFVRQEEEVELNRDEKEEILNTVQLEVERRYHEDNHFIAYGIHDGDIFPAFVKTSEGEIYGNEEWFETAEEMASLDYFFEHSQAIESSTMTGVKTGIPNGLDNYVDQVTEDIDGFEEYDWEEAEGTYLMPRLSPEQYDEL